MHNSNVQKAAALSLFVRQETDSFDCFCVASKRSSLDKQRRAIMTAICMPDANHAVNHNNRSSSSMHISAHTGPAIFNIHIYIAIKQRAVFLSGCLGLVYVSIYRIFSKEIRLLNILRGRGIKLQTENKISPVAAHSYARPLTYSILKGRVL